MNKIVIPHPQAGDYAPYYDRYVSRFKDADIIHVLTAQAAQSEALYGRISNENGHYAYAEGKWSVNDLLQHVIDTERVFCYRALALSRGETQALSGFEQDDWVVGAQANQRVLSELVSEFEIVRASTYMLLSRMTDEQLQRTGTASGNQLKVLAVPYILAGHFAHHAEVIRERYSAVIG